MKLLHFLLLSSSILASTGNSLATPKDVPTAQPLVSIDFPSTWTFKDADLSLQVTTNEKDLSLLCCAMAMGTTHTKAEISECLNQTLHEDIGFASTVSPTDIQEITVDGAKAYKSGGKGLIRKNETLAVIYLLPVNKESSLMISCWGTIDSLKKNEAVISKLIDSIRRKHK